MRSLVQQEEPTNHLRWVVKHLLPVLQQQWEITEHHGNFVQLVYEWRDVPFESEAKE